MREPTMNKLELAQDRSLNEQLVESIDKAISLYLEDKFEDGIETLTQTLKFWDNEQAYISYLQYKRNTDSEFDSNLILCLLKPKHFKFYVRALSYLGLAEDIIKAANFNSIDPENKDGLHIYLSEIIPFLERFGIDEFIDFIKQLRKMGLSRINGIHQILVSDVLIETSDEYKIEILSRIVDVGYDIYFNDSGDANEAKNLKILTKSQLKDKELLNKLGQPDWAPEIYKYIEYLKLGNFDAAIELFRKNPFPQAIKRKWSLKLCTQQILNNLDTNQLIQLFKTLSEIRIGDAYPYIFSVTMKLISEGYRVEAKEFANSQREPISRYLEPLGLPEHLSISTENRMANFKILRSLNFDNLTKIQDFLETVRLIDKNDSIPRFYINYFARYYPSLFGEDELNKALQYAKSSEKLITSVDFHYEMQISVARNDVGEWKKLLELALKNNLLDAKHLILGLNMAIKTGDRNLRDYIFEKSNNHIISSTYLLSAFIEFERSAGNYFEIDQLLTNWIEAGHELRPEEVTHLVRSAEPNFIERVEVSLDNLIRIGYVIPSKAVTSLCERLATRGKIEIIQRLIDKYEVIVGPDIAFAELQLMLVWIGKRDFEKAREVSKKILSREINQELREHIERIFIASENPKESEIIEALKFQFSPSKNIDGNVKIVTFQRAQSGISRAQDIVKQIKNIYDGVCQYCRVPLETPQGRITEAAHIQGLGSPHFGPDVLGNLLCLCPNHHKLFDASGFYLTENLEIYSTTEDKVIGKLLVAPEHELIHSCVSYQRSYAINASAKGRRIWKTIPIENSM